MTAKTPTSSASRLRPWRTLGFRLSVVVVVAVICAVGSTIGFFIVQDFRQTVDAERSRLRSSAAAFAAASATAVSAENRRGVLEVIRGIRGLSHVDYADVTTPDGRTIAEIGTAASLVSSNHRLGDGGLMAIFRADTITDRVEIRNGGEMVGWLSIHADVAWLRDRIFRSLLIAMLFCASMLAIAVTVAWWQIARIVRPLRNLSNEFADIGLRSDLSKRLEASTKDEVGVLSGAFNDMFSRIEERDQLLQRHRETLEETVVERTAQMREAKEDAERANTAKSEFLATVSHEIRTPMNGMLVMAEMLSNARLPEQPNRYAQIILRSGRGMLNILNDILDLSKIESGRLDLEAIELSLDTLVEDVASLFAERAREKNLSIAFVIDPGVPSQVIGDPVRISQILTNLVNNALKFTETGGVTIEIRSQGMNIGGTRQRLGFFVRDTGIGISADGLAKLFSRFSQADSTIARKFGGTGLGLAISKQLVEAMGGAIAATSTQNVGSCFSFEIEFSVARQMPPRISLAGRRILLLDSDPITRSATATMLCGFGASVIVTDDSSPSSLDLVLAREADYRRHAIATLSDAAHPVVLLRHPAESVSSSGFAANIAFPLRRSDMTRLAGCIAGGDFAPLNPANDETPAAHAGSAPYANLRVLVVDDGEVNREVLKETLASFSVSCDLAEDGMTALAKIERSGFDLVFMDCSMPQMDGYEATRRIRAIEQRLGRGRSRIVALTAHGRDTDAAGWQAAGMDAYLTKPFTVAEIANCLADVTLSSADEQALPSRVTPADESGTSSSGWWTRPVLDDETVTMLQMLSVQNGSLVLERIVDLFKTNAPAALRELVAQGDDAAETARLAHALKSMCNSAGADRAAAICETIEAAGKAGEGIPSELYENLRMVLEETYRGLSALILPAPPLAARA